MSGEKPTNSFARTEAERGRLGKRHSPGKRWRRRVMVAALTIGALYGLVSMAYPSVKSFRGRWLAQKAENAIAAGKLTDAQKSVRAAIRLAPHEPSVVRVAARFSTKARSPEAFKYWLELVETPSATDQDRIDLVEAALAMDRLDLAPRYLNPLLAKMPGNRDVLRLLVIEQSEFQNYPKAIEAARLVLATQSANDHDQIRLGQLLVKSTNAVEHEEGKSSLWEIAVGKSSSSPEAITALVDSKRISPVELEILLRRIQTDAEPSLVQRMLAGGIESRLHPERQKTIVDRIFASFDSASLPEKADLARWGLKQSPSQTADLLTSSRIGTNRVLLTIKAEALASSQQWAQLDPLLANPTNQFEESGRALLRARSALGQGRIEAGRGFILEGINIQNADPRALILLAKTAESAGLPADAIHAWERLSENPALIVQASREIMRLSAITGDLLSARRAVQRLSDHMPADDSLSGERAILDSLYGENIPSALVVLGELLKKKPGNTAWRHGLALAKLRNNDATGALSLIEEIAFDWKQYPPRSQAIYIAVLAANGQRETARRFAHQVRLEQLREPERQLIEPWL